jgi:Tol biopolymer transport system component
MASRARQARWLITAAVTLPVFGACDRRSPTSPTGPTEPASITTPVVAEQPSNGPVAFVSDRDGAKAIYMANADGSGVTRLTSGEQPAWAPGGRKLAFQRAGNIYVIGTDGSGEARVTEGFFPSWSPDGITLALSTTNGSIDLVNANGSATRRLINPAIWNSENAEYGAYWPSWSPDGRRIAFIRTSYDDGWALYIVDVDGKTAPRLLARRTSESTSWSADGSRIAFGGGPGVVRVVNADGSSSMNGAYGFDADWTPTGSLIVNQFTGPGDASNPVGSRMRIFLSTSARALIPEAIAPARPDYWDQQAAWAR